MTSGAAVAVAPAVLAVLLPLPAAVADEDGLQHNITYRARVDGLARGALISYRISDTQVSSADPTMLPGRIFESTAVLTDALWDLGGRGPHAPIAERSIS